MDAVSYSHADKQKQRIEKFIEQPDSTSGLVTVPDTIATGESIEIPAGRQVVVDHLDVQGTLDIQGTLATVSGGYLSQTTMKTQSIAHTNGTTAMNIDDNGNIGIGVTPSAWASSWKVLQVGYRSSFSSGSSLDTVTGYNFYKNSSGTNIYLASAGANSYVMDGSYKWLTAPSGTAGNPVTFTTAMTLDASGNLGLGVTPSAWGSDQKGCAEFGSWFSVGSDDGLGSRYSRNGYYNAGWKYKNNGKAHLHYLNSDGSYNWFTASSGTAGNAITWTTAMTLDASGNLKFNSGYGSVATAYGCRAWVNFNGTGTVAIRASGNISSITDLSTGQYTVNFTTAMPDANYVVEVAASGDGAVNSAETYNTSSVRLAFIDYGVSYRDVLIGAVAIFR